MSWHRTWLFARRTMKEIMRYPVNLFFGLAFPVLLLWALSLIYKQVGQIPGAATISDDELAAAISAYAPVFVSLFSGMLIAKDRTSSFLTRLFASPMTAADFTLGYSLPMLVVALAQSLVTFLFAGLFGHPIGVRMLLGAIVVLPTALMYTAIGLLCGTLMSDKAVGGVCGAMLTTIAFILAGVTVPIQIMGPTFQDIAKALPFYNGRRLRENLAACMDCDCVCRGVLACRGHRIRSAQTQCEPVVAGIPEEYMQGRDITIWAPHSKHMAM